MFHDHCCHIAERYRLDTGLIRKEGVENIEYGYVDGVSIGGETLFTVTTGATVRYSRTVVLAVGAANAPKIPSFPSMSSLAFPSESVQACHSMQIKEFPDPSLQKLIKSRQETNVLVVGGGLTSAQITDLAIRRGVTRVWHVMRGKLRVKLFDLDLEWMGKYKNTEHARFWLADSDEERLDIIKEARGGGSITPIFHKHLKRHIASGKAVLRTETQILDATLVAVNGRRGWKLTTDPPMEDAPLFDYMYFATGIQTDFRSLPYLQNMIAQHPIEGRGGLPCLNEDLMWKNGIPLFMIGRMAALRLGPGAANLGGAKVGAERIAWAVEDVVLRSAGAEDCDCKPEEEEAETGMAAYLKGHGNMYSALAMCES